MIEDLKRGIVIALVVLVIILLMKFLFSFGVIIAFIALGVFIGLRIKERKYNRR